MSGCLLRPAGDPAPVQTVDRAPLERAMLGSIAVFVHGSIPATPATDGASVRLISLDQPRLGMVRECLGTVSVPLGLGSGPRAVVGFLVRRNGTEDYFWVGDGVLSDTQTETRWVCECCEQVLLRAVDLP